MFIPLVSGIGICFPFIPKALGIFPLSPVNLPRPTRTSTCTTLTISAKTTIGPRETTISMYRSSEKKRCISIITLDHKLDVITAIDSPLKRIASYQRRTDSEVAIGRVVHHHKGNIFFYIKVKDTYDMRVDEASNDAPLVLKTIHLLIACQPCMQHLNSGLAIEPYMLAQVHLGITASSK